MKNIVPRKFTFSTQSNFSTIGYQQKTSILVYFILGAVFVGQGCNTFFENPYICVPAQVYYSPDDLSYYIKVFQGVFHLSIELSATFIVIGGILLWAAFNFSKSDNIDFLLFIFFSISTFIHWNESFDEARVIHSPLISLIPLILIIIVIIIKRSQNNEYRD